MLPEFDEELLAGEYDAIISNVERRCANDGHSGWIGVLGCILLLKREFDRAYQVFTELIEEPEKYGEIYKHAMKYFCYLGTASWCSGRKERAVAEWKLGLKCPYTESAGGIQAPVLLAYAALMSNEISLGDADRILQKKLQHRLAINWYGELGRLVLGVLPELDFTKWTAGKHELLVNRMKVEYYFSVAIRAKRDTDTTKCEEYMRACADCSPLFGVDIPEWHLARYEVAKLIASGE